MVCSFLFICSLFFVHLFTYLFVCIFVCPSVHSSICPSIHPSILGFLYNPSTTSIIYKSAVPPKGPREIAFYEDVCYSSHEQSPKDIIELKEIVPKYYGTIDIQDRAGQISILNSINSSSNCVQADLSQCT